MKAKLLLFISFFFLSLQLWAQPVVAVADRDSILIGEKIQLHLKAFYDADQKPEWFNLDTIPHFEIMERSAIDSQKVDDNLILTQTLTLTSWDSGSWNIPPLRLPQGSSSAIRIYVGYTPFDVSQPYNDIHDIVDVKTPKTSSWYWYFLAVIILIALAMLLFPGKKEKEAGDAPDPGAYARAMKQLRELDRSGLAEQDVKEFYSKLVDIFRHYLQSGRRIYSFSRTTTDLAVKLQDLNLPQADYTALVQVLKQSDLVKFARYNPGKKEAETAFDVIHQTINTIEKGHAV
ncbi:MAG: hypothetical protein ACO1OO_13495 [Flavisolibacter sp.]